MKIYSACFLLAFLVLGKSVLAQNIVVSDTVSIDGYKKGANTFLVQGKILGIDSGSIKCYSINSQFIFYVPFKDGKFQFYGTIDSVETLSFEIKGDYYINSFYLEPGEIKIDLRYQKTFISTGTPENDSKNYFYDTLAKPIMFGFNYFGRKIDTAMQLQDLNLYLSIFDSIVLLEKQFFAAVHQAIDEERWGIYLINLVNFYYTSYGHFEERHRIFNRLPSRLKTSAQGQGSYMTLTTSASKYASFLNKKPADFLFELPNNSKVSFRKYKGKVVVLDFWASWCLPCIKSLPLLKSIYEKFKRNGVVFVSLSIDKNREAWISRNQQLKMAWVSGLVAKATADSFGAESVPTYLLIDKSGKVISRTGSLGTLFLSLNTLLGKRE